MVNVNAWTQVSFGPSANTLHVPTEGSCAETRLDKVINTTAKRENKSFMIALWFKIGLHASNILSIKAFSMKITQFTELYAPEHKLRVPNTPSQARALAWMLHFPLLGSLYTL